MYNKFITATSEYNTFDNPVPAYYFRRKFQSDSPKTAILTVAVCGFYELYFNGEHITRGFLSPYISNTDDYVYYDEYTLTLSEGENVIGLILGNGFQNNPGGYNWDFDKADFRSAPKLALSLTESYGESERIILESDESFKIAPSPIRSDDYRFGEHYDARYEIDGWADIGFDDAAWDFAMLAKTPKGELRLADVAPIVKEREIEPISITPSGSGYIYDFGESNAGVCRLSISGERGQKIELRYSDGLRDGDISIEQVWFVKKMWERDKSIVHFDSYVCRGGTETYEPSFTYHGFRYVRVDGITEKQATKDLLTYLVYHTDLKTRGDFTSSDECSTRLQEMTRRSILSNFHHFPTDCPQREKNGWTADAALTCEAALLNFDPERGYREWLRNIRKAQREDGSLPGIVPTTGWGFHWGNGPAWDSVLAYLPYYTYVYRGETEMITESKDAFLSYLGYLRGRVDENGLLSIGLGDWCHIGRINPKAPLLLTDSVIAMDIAKKISFMFSAINMKVEADYALAESEKYRTAIRAHLIDHESMTAIGNCQTSQAMCLYYGVFESDEKQKAFKHLLKLIDDFDGHIDLGVLGGRVIFHVLSEFGESDLAYNMITREDFPSYGNWIKRGATTLWEDFLPDGASSMNHHFWGDISAWFIKCVAGIRFNPTGQDIRAVHVRPSFIEKLDHASAYHISPYGKIAITWQRTGDTITLKAEIPRDVHATAILPEGYAFDSGKASRDIRTGAYTIRPTDSFKKTH